MADPFLDTIEKYLRQGKLEPCYHLILQYAQRSETSRQAAVDALGQTLDQLLDEFVVGPVVALCADLDTQLPPEISEPIKQRIGRRVQVIRDWAKKTELVHRERLARELRAAVRRRDLGEAEQWAGAMLGSGRGRPADRALAQYVGSILGSILHGQREAEQLVTRLRSNAKHWGLSEGLLDDIETMRRQRYIAVQRGGSEFPEAEYVRELNTLTVELKSWLPGPRVTSQPTADQIERFYHALHAVVASVFLMGDKTRWTDVTLVLADYCPRELSVAGRRAGVEERAYMTLTPAARRTVFEAFGRLGQNETVVRSYLEFASSASEERTVRNIADVMGALRSKRHLGWLRKTFEADSRAAVRNTVLVAVSNYAEGDAAELILRALDEAVRKGSRKGVIPVGPERRQAEEAVFALGRIVRSPRMDSGGRNEILKRAMSLIPEKDPRLAYELAYQCFRTPSEGWDAKLRDRAAGVLTRSFWLGDLTPDFAKGEEREPDILGWRRPAAQALIAIGRDTVPVILHECEDSALRYGGAYVALAEVLGQLADPRALDLLERLLANTVLFEGSDRTKYQLETYYDATDDVRKDLTSDQVLAALLYAIERIGGERADAMLVRAYSQILAPGNQAVGQETAALLEKARARLVRDGRWDDLVQHAGQRRTDQEQDVNGADARKAAAAALKTLRARVFWPGKRRPAKITAIQTLAGQRNLEAIPLIVAHLEDSDSMIRGAAETALTDYAWSASNESVALALTYALLECLIHPNDRIHEIARSILKRVGPSREPLRSKLTAIMNSASNPRLRAEASRLLREGQTPDMLDALGGAGPQEAEQPEQPPEQETAPAETSPKPAGLNEVYRLKREYLRARQDWIRGGKKGEPPKPPPGG